MASHRIQDEVFALLGTHQSDIPAPVLMLAAGLVPSTFTSNFNILLTYLLSRDSHCIVH